MDSADDNMELAVTGGNHDMIPTPEENMPASVEDRWGAGEWGTPEEDSNGVIQCWEEEREGEGGTGGVPVCLCCC